MKYNFEPPANVCLAAVYNKKIAEISTYYLQLFAELKLSGRLSAEEKAGQINFMLREWEREYCDHL